MREGHRVHFSECDNQDWVEVDFHPDLDRMRHYLRANLPKWT
jgi:hypothetical protein